MIKVLGAIIGWFLLMVVVLLFSSSSGESRERQVVKAAAKGDVPNLGELARSYWKLYEATHRRKSEWLMLDKMEKSSIYAAREELRDLFERFPQEAQRFVMGQRPNRKF